MNDERMEILDCAQRGREAATVLRGVTREAKDAALRSCAAALRAETARIVEVNALDLDRAREAGTSAALIDRLTLDAIWWWIWFFYWLNGIWADCHYSSPKLEYES